VKVTPKKVVWVEALGASSYETVKLTLPAGIEVRYCIEGLQAHLETDAVPHLLDHLSNLAIKCDVSVAEELERSTHSARLPEQRFGLLRVVLQAATALQVSEVAAWIVLVEHVTLAVEHRVLEPMAGSLMRGY
jgi:hypothetical protein